MRKLLVLSLLLTTLTACAAADAPVLPTAPVPMHASAPLEYTVETVRHESTIQTEDSGKLAEIVLELPELSVLRPDGTRVVLPQNDEEKTALATAETFNSQFQEWVGEEDLAGLTQRVEEEYALCPEFFTAGGYYTEGLDVSVYQTEKLVSVCGEYDTYTGGAHPNTVLLGWNFDLTTGTFLEVSTLAVDVGDFLAAVTDEIISQAQAVAAENGMTEEEFYLSNYREIVAGWNSYAVSFDEYGMTVGFSPYELACYAAGPQRFTLSYDMLRPQLNARGLELLGKS